MELELPGVLSSLRPTHLCDLRLPSLKLALEKIFSLGMEMAPEEACGIVVREARCEFRVVQLHNRSDDPCSSYRIDVDTIRSITMRPRMWSHVAVWHTHPGGTVGPSEGDLRTKVPGVKYLVVTVPSGEVREF